MKLSRNGLSDSYRASGGGEWRRRRWRMSFIAEPEMLVQKALANLIAGRTGDCKSVFGTRIKVETDTQSERVDHGALR